MAAAAVAIFPPSNLYIFAGLWNLKYEAQMNPGCACEPQATRAPMSSCGHGPLLLGNEQPRGRGSKPPPPPPPPPGGGGGGFGGLRIHIH